MFTLRASTRATAVADDCFDVLKCIMTGHYYVIEKTHPTGRITTTVKDEAEAYRLVCEYRQQHDAAYHRC